VKAAHVLIPQVERGLRKLAEDLGVPVTRPHPSVSETSVVIGMGEFYKGC
jgi:lysyl-tRNA synthetase class 1